MRRDLVQRAMDGDHEAFSELVRLSIDRLYAIARLTLHDEEQAKDATQEALVAAWRDLSALRDPDRFDAWLRRLLVHACYRQARKDRARQRMELHVERVECGTPDASRELADRDELERSLARLAPQQRALLVMHYYLGLPMQETADTLGWPLGTVKSRLYRTTNDLRATLDAEARNGSGGGPSR